MRESSNLTTLCYLERNEHYLMMHRISKRKDLNQGKWIGVGGHFQKGESPEECLLREVREETGVLLTSYRLRGIITFVSDEWGEEYMFLYTADGFRGEPDLTNRKEGVLSWVPKSKVLSLPLWEGDKVFLKLLWEDAPFFSLKLIYHGDILVGQTLQKYDTFSR